MSASAASTWPRKAIRSLRVRLLKSILEVFDSFCFGGWDVVTTAFGFFFGGMSYRIRIPLYFSNPGGWELIWFPVQDGIRSSIDLSRHNFMHLMYHVMVKLASRNY